MSRDCHLPVVHPVTVLAVAMETGREGAVHWGHPGEGSSQKDSQEKNRLG